MPDKSSQNSIKNEKPNYTGRVIVGQNQKNPGDFALWKFVEKESLQKWQFNQYNSAKKILDSIYFNQLADFENAPENEQNNDEKYPIYPNISKHWGCPGWHSECVAMICAILGQKTTDLQKNLNKNPKKSQIDFDNNFKSQMVELNEEITELKKAFEVVKLENIFK